MKNMMRGAVVGLSIFVYGCVPVVIANDEIIHKDQREIQKPITQPSQNSIEPDLTEVEMNAISEIIHSDIEKAVQEKNQKGMIQEIIPMSSGAVRVIIQFIVRYEMGNTKRDCDYTVWFVRENATWTHEKYRTDEKECEI